MVKPELGLKRTCVACGAKFYDLGRAPPTCPKCGTEQPSEQPRVRRPAAPADDRLRKRAVAAVPEGGEDEPEVEEAEGEAGVEDAEELEDADEDLGEEIGAGGENEEET